MAWAIYSKMLRTLLSELQAALDNPTVLVQAAVVRQGLHRLWYPRPTQRRNRRHMK